MYRIISPGGMRRVCPAHTQPGLTTSEVHDEFAALHVLGCEFWLSSDVDSVQHLLCCEGTYSILDVHPAVTTLLHQAALNNVLR